MSKLLLFSHSGFSDENANGITMKNLLSSWSAAEKAEFYCDVQPPDFTAAHHYFRVTDMEMVKSFFGKRSQRAFSAEADQKISVGKNEIISTASRAKNIPRFLKKRKYNFVLKWIREWMRMIGPWGHREYWQWLREVSPDVLVYMVGESLFMDRLVLQTLRKTGKPLVLYNGEAYRIIDIQKRKGLERAYYRRAEKLYDELNRKASLVIYNCEMLRRDYEAMYRPSAKAIVAYNSADLGLPEYCPGEHMRITYFGNLGVGRGASLLEVASVLREIDPKLALDIYGNAPPELEITFLESENICYRGFVNAARLREIIGESDILLHAESFHKSLVEKLRYAFSTKIAQCLGAGRCFISYAPRETASTQYLHASGMLVASDRDGLKGILCRAVKDPLYRVEWARRSWELWSLNHRMEKTAREIRDEIEKLGV